MFQWKQMMKKMHKVLFSVYNDTVLTRLTELKALPACQLLVQDASQDGGQQQDRPAHGWVVGGDQGVGHEGYTTFGCRFVTYRRNNTHCERCKCLQTGV